MTKNVHTSLVVAFLSFLRIIWVSLAFFLACLTERSIWNPAFSDVSFGSCSSSSAIFLDNNWQDFFCHWSKHFFLKDYKIDTLMINKYILLFHIITKKFRIYLIFYSFSRFRFLKVIYFQWCKRCLHCTWTEGTKLVTCMSFCFKLNYAYIGGIWSWICS